MLSFLFWNLMGEHRPGRHDSLCAHLGRLAANYDVDLFLFVEPAFPAAELAMWLSRSGGGSYQDAPSATDRIQILSRLPRSVLINQFDSVDERMTMRRILLAEDEMLLAVMHFHSQRDWTPAAQAQQATTSAADIRAMEDEAGHRRTVLVGDLNMNPFEHGLVGALALNAVMTRQVAQAGERQVSGRRYRFFYNPMWGLFGDRTPGPSGTFYRAGGDPQTYYWHMFDQVLLRPELMNSLKELRILDTDGEQPLLTPVGHPRTATASDHLPLLVRLDLNVRKE